MAKRKRTNKSLRGIEKNTRVIAQNARLEYNLIKFQLLFGIPIAIAIVLAILLISSIKSPNLSNNSYTPPAPINATP